MENAKKKRKSSNFYAAEYIAESQGNDVPDEMIIKVAKDLHMKPKVLLKNYKFIADVNKIFNKYLPNVQKTHGGSLS